MAKPIPKYRRQKRPNSADQGFVELNGQRFYLGHYGSRTSRREYHRLLAEWTARGGELPADKHEITVVELCARFNRHARNYYRQSDGSPSREVEHYRPVLSILKDLYGRTLVHEFTPMALKTCRQRMIDKGWSRRHVNRSLVRTRSIFKWGVSEALVPVEVHSALCTVTGLRVGRCAAREKPPIRPVQQHEIDAVLPKVSPVVAHMVRVQLLTAMRPGEVCMMRPIDIDMSGKLWLYRPQTHKTRHLGRERVVHVGPKAQAVLRPYLISQPLDGYIFSPREAEHHRYAACEVHRRPNQMPNHRKTDRRLRDRYDTTTYARAIRRGCEIAGLKPHWAPNQLRHTAATLIRKEAGLEVARAVLGHTTAGVTEQFYAEADHAKSAAIIARVG